MKRLKNGRTVHGDATPPAPLTEERVAQLVGDRITEFSTKTLPGLLKPLDGLAAFQTQFSDFLAKQTTPPVPEVKKPEGTREENAVILGMQRELDAVKGTQSAETKRREAAEKRAAESELENVLTRALGDFDFTSPEAAADAFALIKPMLTRAEDGVLIGPGNVAADVFVKDHVATKKAHLLKPEGVRGSGAKTGAVSRLANGTPIGYETIKPGMTPEELKAVGAQIRAAVPQYLRQ